MNKSFLHRFYGSKAIWAIPSSCQWFSFLPFIHHFAYDLSHSAFNALRVSFLSWIFKMMCITFINKWISQTIHETANGQRLPGQQTNKKTQNAVHLQSSPVWYSLIFGFYSLICFSIVSCFSSVSSSITLFSWRKNVFWFAHCTFHSYSSIHFLERIHLHRVIFSSFFNSEKNENKNETFYI